MSRADSKPNISAAALLAKAIRKVETSSTTAPSIIPSKRCSYWCSASLRAASLAFSEVMSLMVVRAAFLPSYSMRDTLAETHSSLPCFVLILISVGGPRLSLEALGHQAGDLVPVFCGDVVQGVLPHHLLG